MAKIFSEDAYSLELELKDGQICKKTKYHTGIVDGHTFMNQFMNKLNNGEFKKDICPQTGRVFNGKEEVVKTELASFGRLIESGIMDEILVEDNDDFRLYKKEDDNVVTSYLDSHLEGGIKQKNLDLVLDLMDEYVEVTEAVSKEEKGQVKKLVPNKK